MSDEEVRLVEAAVKLGASYNQTLRWVLVGRLKGRRREGRWFVDAHDLERLDRQRHAEQETAAR
jgi:hypothetical protein